MDKLKVLHVVKWYPNQFDVQNGVFIKNHISAIAQKTQSIVLFFKEDPSLKAEYKIVEQQEDGYKSFLVYHAKFNLVVLSILKLKMYQLICRQENFLPQIVHLHILSADQYLFYKLAKKKKVPVFITEHWSGYLDGRFKKMPRIKKAFYKNMAKNAACIFPVSTYLKKGMEKLLPGHYSIVPNVVEVAMLNKPPQQPPFVFIVIADFDDQNKNISDVVRSFNSLKVENAILKIVGTGPDQSKIEALVKKTANKNIFLLGRINHESALAQLAKAHCLVVNSSTETFSVVAVEARGLGLQVICTRCGGPQEILDDSTQWIDAKNSNQLLQAMKNALNASPLAPMDISNYSKKSIVIKVHKHYLQAIH